MKKQIELKRRNGKRVTNGNRWTLESSHTIDKRTEQVRETFSRVIQWIEMPIHSQM